MAFYGVFDHGAAAVVSETVDLMADTIKVRLIEMTDQPEIYGGYAPDLINHEFMSDDPNFNSLTLGIELVDKAYVGGVFSATAPFKVTETAAGYLYTLPLIEGAATGFGLLIYKDTGDDASSNVLALIAVGETGNYVQVAPYQELWFGPGNLFTLTV
jgi:hypothetical protein